MPATPLGVVTFLEAAFWGQLVLVGLDVLFRGENLGSFGSDDGGTLGRSLLGGIVSEPTSRQRTCISYVVKLCE